MDTLLPSGLLLPEDCLCQPGAWLPDDYAEMDGAEAEAEEQRAEETAQLWALWSSEHIDPATGEERE